MAEFTTLLREDGERIAYMARTGASPGILWLGGFKSEMTATKASALDAWAERTGHAFVRFDYFGHGRSSGEFREGTITRWCGDVLAVLDQVTSGPQILVGSSMGGYLALLAARMRPERIAALLPIAPAADFTEALLWAGMQDSDVPWQHAFRLFRAISSEASLTLVRDGDHRLSTPSDILRMEHVLDALVAQGAAR